MAFEALTASDRYVLQSLEFWQSLGDHAQVARNAALARLTLGDEALESLDEDRWFSRQDEMLRLAFLSKLHSDRGADLEQLAEATLSLAESRARIRDLRRRFEAPERLGGDL